MYIQRQLWSKNSKMVPSVKFMRWAYKCHFNFCVFKLFHGFKNIFFLIKRSMQQQIWNLTTEFSPCCASFKVIKVLFPSISRAHGNQERVHQGLPSSLSLRLSKTPEEAALGYLGDGEHNVSGCYQGVGISHQPVADHLGKHHADWLAQHHSFCFDTTHTCMQ